MDLVLVALPSSGLKEVAAPGSLEELARWIQVSGISASALINNAGVGYNGRFEDATLREDEACSLLKDLALVQITRPLLPELRRHPRAYVLNVASLAADFPMPFTLVYAPSKAFILSFGLALREELRGSSVSISVLCTNGIRTSQACRERIERAGILGKVTRMDADQVAVYAIVRTPAGDAVMVRGWVNRMIVAAGRLAPGVWSMGSSQGSGAGAHEP
jgi:short-subunit dehydrogenase